jgi:hypothetical protein
MDQRPKSDIRYRRHLGGTSPHFNGIPFGQKIVAVEGIVPVGRNLVGQRAAIGIGAGGLSIFALDCCESHSQKQAQP